ncbi:MAG TPA: hypothetical protein VI981_02560 [Candidatus Paceibacterota bacterium]
MLDLLALTDSGVYRGIVVLLTLYPIWLPLVLAAVFWEHWLDYVRANFIKEQGSVLLEIRLPIDIVKNPKAMEIFYTALYQTGTATYIETYIKGKVKPWFSIEMCSFGGQIKFFIWTWPKYRNLVETQLYGQFPSIEIIEAPDYTKNVHHDPVNLPLWGTNFKMVRDQAFPLKTYFDYGLHTDPKEEYKIDPMTSTIEFLGSAQKGEQIWIQILFQAHKKMGLKEGEIIHEPLWTKESRHEIEQMTNKLRGESEYPRPLTEGERDLVAAMERKVMKWPFEVMIRGFYIATKEANRINLMIAGLLGSFRQYSAPDGFNEIKVGKFTDYDYPWQDFRRQRRDMVEKKMLDAYKKRSYFNYPYENFRGKRYILSTEELATIFHFPGRVATTPTFDRIVSKKGEPPANLPI